MINGIKDNALLRAFSAFLVYELMTNIYASIRNALQIVRISNLQWLGDELICVVIAVIIAIIFKTTNTLKDPLKGLGKSILCGSWFLLICLVGTVVQLLKYTSEGPGLKSPIESIIYIFFILAIGFAEEILHRGTVTELLVRKYGNSVKGKLFSIFTGAFIFSIFHLTNVRNGQSLENTVYQMISVFCMALFLNTIYVKYRNLYAMILIHGALDYMKLFDYGMVKGTTLNLNFGSESKTVMWSFVICNILYIIAAVIIFVVTNRKGGKRNVQKDS